MALKFTDQNALLFIFQKIKGAFVQKETGKGLSSNDFTDDLKTRLESVQQGAEKNVQADWSAATGPAAVLNKPSKVSQFENDAGYIKAADIPEGAAASSTPPKMDGEAAVGEEMAFSRGDHRHPTDTTRVPTTRKVNGKTLESDVTLAAADVGAIPSNAKGTANGVASLDADGKVPSSQLPSYVDDVVEGYLFNDKFYEDADHSKEIAGEKSKIYVDLDNDGCYRYSGTTYVKISSSDMVPLTNEEIEDIYNNA